MLFSHISVCFLVKNIKSGCIEASYPQICPENVLISDDILAY